MELEENKFKVVLQQRNGPVEGILTRQVMLEGDRNSDVPAWLGLKALALAWPEMALACSDPILGQSCHSGLGLGLAQPRLQLVYVQTSQVIQQKLKTKTFTFPHGLLLKYFSEPFQAFGDHIASRPLQLTKDNQVWIKLVHT